MSFLHSINWEEWASFFAALGAGGGALWFLTKRFLVPREEFTSMVNALNKHIGHVSSVATKHDRDILSIFRERKSFREEVLDRVEKLSERVDSVANDVSDLKDLIIQRVK